VLDLSIVQKERRIIEWTLDMRENFMDLQFANLVIIISLNLIVQGGVR
jgi:hypothetical protein